MLMVLMLAGAGRVDAGLPHGEADPHSVRTPQYISQVTADSIAYAAKVANGNLVGVTITNYGFIGNNFISRDPSLKRSPVLSR